MSDYTAAELASAAAVTAHLAELWAGMVALRDAFRLHTGTVDTNQPLPPWAALTDDQRDAWRGLAEGPIHDLMVISMHVAHHHNEDTP